MKLNCACCLQDFDGVIALWAHLKTHTKEELARDFAYREQRVMLWIEGRARKVSQEGNPIDIPIDKKKKDPLDEYDH